MALYKIPDGAHADMAALDILVTVLADTPSGACTRLWLRARRQRARWAA